MSYYEYSNNSQPPTPRENYQWEQQTQPAESQPHSEPQHSQPSLDQQQLVTPTRLQPTLPHIEEPQQLVPTQRPQRGQFDMAPVRLHPPVAGRSPPIEIKPVLLQVDTSVRQTSRANTRPPHQHNFHPYQRPSSAAARREMEAHQHIRFASQASTPQAHPGSAAQSPAPGRQTFTTSPLSEFTPLAQQGSSSSFVPNSPHGALQDQESVMHSFVANPTPATATEAPKRYLIRADTNYDPLTRILTATLEVPGVRKDDLTIKLATTPFNRLRQLVVLGHSYPPFAPTTSPSALRERKYGMFSRHLPVASDTRPTDIDATMEDGILVLKIQCGFPAPSADQHEIPIR
ncbi:hypothetical protein MIND_00761400 [Mycena indigotica]|uniref:SHSP domain-containing protein n=1 Tax=Mycena indigotica TaxID=2126181 RepID=A0A8H6W4Y5_9AGAR|nr:uncharacterized protein MIND_00761400 [Mycena indigotica]KAF7301953.1 hypothetical protein MIND_00761400 [Mycena indigotica]